MDKITKDVLKFKETGKGKKELWENISISVYFYPEKVLKWEKEICCEFYLSFLPRIDRLVERFVYSGSSFSTYLNNTLKWHSRTFLKQQMKGDRMDTLLEREKQIIYDYEVFEAGHSNDSEDDLLINPKEMSISFKSGALFYYLLNFSNLDDACIKKISGYFGMKESEFFESIAALKERVKARICRYNQLLFRKNELYFSMLSREYEYREEHDPDKKHQLKKKADDSRRRLNNIRRMLREHPYQPTHRDVAEVLGLSRSTISSSIYKMRKKLNEMTQ